VYVVEGHRALLQVGHRRQGADADPCRCADHTVGRAGIDDAGADPGGRAVATTDHHRRAHRQASRRRRRRRDLAHDCCRGKDRRQQRLIQSKLLQEGRMPAAGMQIKEQRAAGI
jgi:hypothetical protein